MNRKYIRSGLVIGALWSIAVTWQTQAEQVFACDLKCSNMYTEARKVSVQHADGDVFSVLDTKSAEVRSYTAVKYTDSRGELVETAAEINPTATANSAQTFFLQHRQSHGVFTVKVPVRDNNVGFQDVNSSSDLIIYPQNQDWVALFLESSASLSQQIEASLSELSQRINLGVDFSMENRIVVQFEDGSTAEFTTVTTLKNGTVYLEVMYVDGSARFVDGSKVPDTKAKYLQNWLFSQETDVRSFTRLGGLWRVKFNEFTSCSNRTEMQCYTDSDGEPVCDVIRKCD